jgi:hypothetical protein
MPVASSVRSQMMRLFKKKKDKSCATASKSVSTSASINNPTTTPSTSKYSELSVDANPEFYRGGTSRGSKIFQSIRKRFSSKSKSSSKLRLKEEHFDSTTPTTTTAHNSHHQFQHHQTPNHHSSYSSYNARSWTGKVNIEQQAKPGSHLNNSIKKSKSIIDSRECSCRHEVDNYGQIPIPTNKSYRPNKSRSKEFMVPIPIPPMPNLKPESTALLSPTEIVIQPPIEELELVDECCCSTAAAATSKPNSRRGSHNSTSGGGGCCVDAADSPIIPAPPGFIEVFAPEHALLQPGGSAAGDSAVSLELGHNKRRSFEINMNTNGNSSANRHSELAVPAAAAPPITAVSSGGGVVSRSHHPHRVSYTGTSVSEKKAAAESRPVSSTMGRPASHRNTTGRRGGKVSFGGDILVTAFFFMTDYTRCKSSFPASLHASLEKGKRKLGRKF